MTNRDLRSFNEEQGFTLIELLVVILIIGILAAIAVPSFLTQRDKSQDTCAKSQVRTMATAMEAFYVDRGGYTATIGDLFAIEQAVTSGAACGGSTSAVIGAAAPVGGTCSGGIGAALSYCVSQSSPSGASFAMYKAPNAPVVRSCGPADRVGKGACPDTGEW